MNKILVVGFIVILIALIGFLFIDLDRDGLSSFTELKYGTKFLEKDTDDDGLTDGEEINIHSTNPKVIDTDGDGLTDGSEVNVHHTDPKSTDTDKDELDDKSEIEEYGTDPLSSDTDSDGVDDKADIYPLYDGGIVVNITYWKELEKADGEDCGDLEFQISARKVPQYIVRALDANEPYSYDFHLCEDAEIIAGILSETSDACASFNGYVVGMNVPDDEEYVLISVMANDLDYLGTDLLGVQSFSIESYDIGDFCEVQRFRESMTTLAESIGCSDPEGNCDHLRGYNAHVKVKFYVTDFTDICPDDEPTCVISE